MSDTHETHNANAGAQGPQIPDKLYFRIGEVARLFDLPPYVLRFWESEFPQLKPGKGGTGQRLYRRRDVETVREIRRLLYDEGYTIAGARQFLKTEVQRSRSGDRNEITAPAAPPAPAETPSDRRRAEREELNRLRAQLYEISGILSRPASQIPGSRPVSRLPLALRRRRSDPDGPPPLFAVPLWDKDDK